MALGRRHSRTSPSLLQSAKQKFGFWIEAVNHPRSDFEEKSEGDTTRHNRLTWSTLRGAPLMKTVFKRI
ncbi:hypothetical protein L596_004278 [Steinernema carpocapsae]|uniref:Uncharacterized protein n=1 Tax=Steinernema carpocapsae TaxID=34508 RepID=A0A4U8UWC0_STECR|nr:hypothetical protein L596_004278 [Steinernema carpocapsae]